MITRLDEQHPWPALLSFTEDDRNFFGGRSEEEAALFSAIRRERLTILYGVSGLGKSSLLCAGVFPKLREVNCFPVLIRLDYNPGAPPLAEQVKQEVRKQTEKHAVEAPPPLPGQTLWQYFHHKSCEFWDSRSRLLTPVLVFDQFEELFTKGGMDSPAVSRFLDELTDLVSGVPERQLDDPAQYHFREHSYRVVFSLREDFFPKLEALSTRFRTIFNNRVPLASMRGKAALESAMRAGGHLMDEETAKRVICVIAGERDPLDTTPMDGAPPLPAKEFDALTVEPALLSLFFSELNEKRLQDKETTIAPPVLNAGTRDEILSAFYDRCFEGLPDAARAFVEEELLSTDGKTRDFISYDRAVADAKITEDQIETLVKRRLLHVEELRTSRRLELSHDVLTSVVRTSRTERKSAEEMARAKRERAAAQEAARLSEAAAREARRDLRNAKIALAVVVLLFLAAIAGPVYGWLTARASRRKQATTAYAAAQQSLDSGHSATALAYLGHALRLDRQSGQVLAVLADLVMNRSWPVESHRFTTSERVVGTVSDDGKRVMRIENGTIVVEELNGSRTFPQIPLPKGGNAMFNTAGNAVIVIDDVPSGGPRISVYDAADGREIQPPAVFKQAWWIDVTPDLRSAVVQQDTVNIYPLPMTATPPADWLKNTRAKFDSPRIDDIEKIEVGGNGLLFIAERGGDPSFFIDKTPHTISRVYDLMRDTPPVQLKITQKPAYARFSSDGSALVLATDSEVRVFDSASGAELTAPIHADGEINASDVNVKQKALVIVTGDTARCWTMDANKPVVGEPIHHRRRITSVHFCDDAQRLVTASADGSARIWDVGTSLPLSEPLQHERPLLSAAFVGQERVVAVDADHTVHVWEIGASDAVTYNERPAMLTVTTDGTAAVTFGQGQMAAWDLVHRNSLAEERLGDSAVAMAFDRTRGRALLLKGMEYVIWDPRGTSVKLEGWTFVSSAKFSGNGRVLAAVSGAGTLRFVDPRTGYARDVMFIRPDQDFEINDDGSRILVSDGDTVDLFDANGRRIGRSIHLPFGVSAFEFSENGRSVVVYNDSQGVTLYDARSGAAVTTIKWESEHPRYATLNASGTRLVILSERNASLWDVNTKKMIGQPFDAGDDSQRARFVGDTLLLIGASSAHLWDTRTSTPLGEPFNCSLPPEVAGSQVYYLSGKRLLRMDATPVAEDDIDTLISISESLSGMSISNDGILSRFFEPERLGKLKSKCAGRASSRVCKVAALLAAKLQ